MMAAIAGAEAGGSVCLLEPNERLGKKLNITGKGRCNLTNRCDLETFLQNVPCNGRFLYSACSQFDSDAVMAFFESLGVPVKVERGNRVFPASDRAFDVSGALEKRMRQLGVRVIRDRAEALLIQDGSLRGVRTAGGDLEAARVIVATGGVSYPLTGSTGDGYRLAEQAGHTVVGPPGAPGAPGAPRFDARSAHSVFPRRMSLEKRFDFICRLRAANSCRGLFDRLKNQRSS